MSEKNISKHLGPYKKWEKALIALLLLSGLVTFTYYCVSINFFLSNDENWCSNQHPEVFYSPDKKYKAISFLRNCGATEGYKPGVSLLLAGEEFNPKPEGNIFQCYRCGCTEVTWVSERELLIEYCWPTGTGFYFESPDDFLTVQKNMLYDVDIRMELIQE